MDNLYHRNGKLNWDYLFKNNWSWPRKSLMLSKVSPSASQGSRSMWAEDKAEILEAAKKYGYKVFSETQNVVTFLGE